MKVLVMLQILCHLHIYQLVYYFILLFNSYSVFLTELTSLALEPRGRP